MWALLPSTRPELAGLVRTSLEIPDGFPSAILSTITKPMDKILSPLARIACKLDPIDLIFEFSVNGYRRRWRCIGTSFYPALQRGNMEHIMYSPMLWQF